MPILRTSSICGALCAVLLTACGGNHTAVGGTTGSGGSTSSGTGGGGGGTGNMAATHPALPQVVNLGGPVLKTPKVQPIAYSDDVNRTDIDKFLQELTTTTFWSQTTAEYGVGPLTVLPTIVRPENAPASLSDDQMNLDLAANLAGANPAWGAADPGTIYLFLAPVQTKVAQPNTTDPNVAYGCTEFDGYHGESAITSSLSVPYAVGCSCPGFDGKAVTAIQERTVAISHELVEAATDPFPNTNPAYGQEDNADIVWTIAGGGGELADMCQFNDDSFVVPPGSAYMVQRSWSNKAAKAGTNPCVPVVAKDPYFNSFPVLPDTLSIAAGGPIIKTPGVKIPVGGTKTIDIDLFSDGPTSGPWKVTVYDAGYYIQGAPSKYLQLTLDKNTGQSGDTLHLTITVLKADTQFNTEAFLIDSTLNGQSNLWMAYVGQ